jgi:hypothetical protein
MQSRPVNFARRSQRLPQPSESCGELGGGKPEGVELERGKLEPADLFAPPDPVR